MPRTLRTIEGSRRRLLRGAALAVLALQGTVTLAPLVEPSGEGRLSAHAEQDGTRHANVHDPATCALCSASAQTYLPASPGEHLAHPQPRVVGSSATFAVRSRDDAVLNHSRAPPRLPG